MNKDRLIKLSVCIPTYNRKDKVIGLLNYLIREGAFSDDRIEVLVSDNCSDDNTYNDLVLFKDEKSLEELKLLKNNINVGLTGNILKLAEQARGEYIWFLGDDDIYHEGLVKRALDLVCKDYFSYIFINHTTFIKEIGDGEQTMLEWIDLNREDSDIILDILRKHPGAPMFMSAEIYEKKLVQEFITKKYPINICLPLGLSLFCASKGKVGLVQEPMIDDNIGVISWTDVIYKVDLFYRPVYYRMALSLPFSFRKRVSLFLHYIHERRKRYFYYCIVNPIKKLIMR
jgi:glycosyltransferase involved in cell wall biosynthesis